MELGTIVFYQHYDEFQRILNHMNAKEQALCIDDNTFKDHYGYERQALFHVLYQSNTMWGFICATIKRKDGKTGYKILNANNKVNQINEDQIYFALTMDDFTFTHWAEMKDDKNVLHSLQGGLVMKKPSNSTVKKSKRVKKVFGLGENMLYQIVSLKSGMPSYPSSNPFNSQWEKYNPYNPSQDDFKKWYNGFQSPKHYNRESMMRNPYEQIHPTPPYEKPKEQPKWYNTTTLHAVPFLRDNIKPTTFSVAKQIKSFENDLRMFINFPNGIPINLL